MKKAFSLILCAALCTLLLVGCHSSDNSPSSLSAYRYDHSDRYTMGGATLTDTVKQIDIDWISGSVLVTTHQEDTITFGEKANRDLDTDNTLYYWLDGTTLRIKFRRSGEWDFSHLEKDLTLELPDSLMPEELKISTVSSEINVDTVSASRMNLDSVSGDIRLTNSTVTEKADIDSVSGKITIAADEIKSIDAETTSGNLYVSVRTLPSGMDLETVSGAVELYLPANGDFTLEFDTVSGKLSSELPYKTNDETYIYGKGTNYYSIDTVSGSVKVREVGDAK